LRSNRKTSLQLTEAACRFQNGTLNRQITDQPL